MNLLYRLTQFSLTIVVFMLAGCASMQWPPQEQVVLEQLYTAQQWTPDQLESELPTLEQAFAQQPTTVNRLRLAVALGFGRCHTCDSARALTLFKETLESAQDDAVIALASLCIDVLEAKARIAENNAALLNGQQRINELQQKLDDLTSIEESLHLRD